MGQLPDIQRMTAQRQVIFEELRSVGTHPTAAEVYEMVRKRLPHVSLGTVYRNLDTLARSGMIHKIEIGDGPARFDADLSQHYHIRCVSCGRLDDIMGVSPDMFDGSSIHSTDYELRGVRIEFFGVCPACRAQEAEGDKHGQPQGDPN